MRINFDFSDLQAFLAVSEWGSFQLAAEKLNISQSAVTRRIQKLEAQLETTLFERTTRTLKMTFHAKSFRVRAQNLVDDAAEAMRALNDESQRYAFQKSSVITIAAVPTSTHDILPEVIKKFQLKGYQSKINILDLFANDVSEAVLQGEADFGISFSGIEEPGLSVENLFEDAFVLVMKRHHFLAKQVHIQWSQLSDQHLIVPWKGTGNRMLIDNAMAKSNIVLDWRFQVHHSSTALGLVEKDVGVAVLPASAVPDRLGSNLVYRRIMNPEITRMIGLLKRTHHQISPAAQEFYDLLLEYNQNKC